MVARLFSQLFILWREKMSLRGTFLTPCSYTQNNYFIATAKRAAHIYDSEASKVFQLRAASVLLLLVFLRKLIETQGVLKPHLFWLLQNVCWGAGGNVNISNFLDKWRWKRSTSWWNESFQMSFREPADGFTWNYRIDWSFTAEKHLLDCPESFSNIAQSCKTHFRLDVELSVKDEQIKRKLSRARVIIAMASFILLLCACCWKKGQQTHSKKNNFLKTAERMNGGDSRNPSHTKAFSVFFFVNHRNVMFPQREKASKSCLFMTECTVLPSEISLHLSQRDEGPWKRHELAFLILSPLMLLLLHRRQNTKALRKH